MNATQETNMIVDLLFISILTSIVHTVNISCKYVITYLFFYFKVPTLH